MAEGLCKELIDKYEKIRAEKDELKAKTTQNNEDFRNIQLELARAINNADMSDVSDGEYVYIPSVTPKWSFKSIADLEEAGLDKFKPFEDDESLKALVKKDINWQSLNSALKELNETEEGIPEEILAVLNPYEEIGIIRRNKDTGSKKKVKEAFMRREENNVQRNG